MSSGNELMNFWKEFIQIYKENPCLWDMNCIDYNITSKRNLAYGILIEKFWDINDTADLDTVKKKIASFRSSMRREMIKMKKNESLGRSYVSKWPYFPYLSFLTPQVLKSGNEDDDVTDADDTDIADDGEKTVEFLCATAVPDIGSVNKTASMPIDTHEQEIDSSTHTDREEIDYSYQPAKKRMKTAPTKEMNAARDTEDLEDDCSTFAAHLKTRMRSFNPQQKCIALKLISDVLFMAETNQLTLTSRFENS